MCQISMNASRSGVNIDTPHDAQEVKPAVSSVCHLLSAWKSPDLNIWATLYKHNESVDTSKKKKKKKNFSVLQNIWQGPLVLITVTNS